MYCQRITVLYFFFNDTATTEIYTLSLHDALPIFVSHLSTMSAYNDLQSQLFARFSTEAKALGLRERATQQRAAEIAEKQRSEEHTSELQSRQYLVCRLLLEKKNTKHPKLLHNVAR